MDIEELIKRAERNVAVDPEERIRRMEQNLAANPEERIKRREQKLEQLLESAPIIDQRKVLSVAGQTPLGAMTNISQSIAEAYWEPVQEALRIQFNPIEESAWKISGTGYSIRDYTRFMPATPFSGNWKPILVNWSKLPEVLFTASLPEVERLVYASARSSILEVAQQLREAYDSTSLKVFAGWGGTPHRIDFFTLDLDRAYDLDFGAPLSDGSVLTVPSETAPKTPRRVPEFTSPLDSIDTLAQQRPLIVKRVVVWIGDHPWVVRIVGGTAGTVAGGVAGSEIGGLLGSAVGHIVGQVLIVFIEKSCATYTKNDKADQ